MNLKQIDRLAEVVALGQHVLGPEDVVQDIVAHDEINLVSDSRKVLHSAALELKRVLEVK